MGASVKDTSRRCVRLRTVEVEVFQLTPSQARLQEFGERQFLRRPLNRRQKLVSKKSKRKCGRSLRKAFFSVYEYSTHQRSKRIIFNAFFGFLIPFKLKLVCLQSGIVGSNEHIKKKWGNSFYFLLKFFLVTMHYAYQKLKALCIWSMKG